MSDSFSSGAGAASAAGAMAASESGPALMPLPPREQTKPDDQGISIVTEYRHAGDGTVTKHVMKVRTVQKTTTTSKAAVARKARMKKFGAAADPKSTDNVTYYDLNLVKMRRPGDTDDSNKETDALIEVLRSGVRPTARDAAPAAAAAAAAAAGGRPGMATSTWAAKFANAESQGIVGAAEAARGGAPSTAPSTSGKYVPPGASGRAGAVPMGETEENTTSLKVSNLADDVTEEQLREHFGAFGRITRVRIMSDHRTGESRGFGFVTFAFRREAQAAKDECSKSHLNNMVMDIEWAKPQVRTGPDSSMRHATGYGGKLPQNMKSSAF